jgi:hypothetical protein
MPTCISEVDQCVQIAVADGIYAAAATTVTAIRPTERDELFAPEAHAPITAVARSNVDQGFIYEFHKEPVDVEAAYEASRPRIKTGSDVKRQTTNAKAPANRGSRRITTDALSGP